ncbi:alpha-glutamyl/putrescinyl thymine pyrophosphorylase clade 3 protein [Burkholderia pseudomallei]|uniref:alpha-glutamyl/putrescinyl thymine pyrophosphorylase clade 3 protein n=1 Tax=Burkholderia pseudomallei TaxID=28450 RepID=UPI00097821B1|nr:hypothetical protein [Burkholderia pseudomallei]OMR89919.1 hypothetical protein AQ733_17790 [Burkholderia pseudomallei]OMS16427.1 hypothetical protein AQ735_27435 [Burkholderia pseudomallei]
MAKNDQQLKATLAEQLRNYRVNGKPLPGIENPTALDTLVRQMVESVHRVQYVRRILDNKAKITERRANPKDDMFDPIRAAVWHMDRGNIDEAFWIVFLFVVCGKHLKTGYALLRMVYGAFNDKFIWTWEQYHQEPNGFSLWLHDRLPAIERQGGFHFGNHRRYESIKNLDLTLQSYAEWVGPNHSHMELIDAAMHTVGDDPKMLFAHLYASMDSVARFGRLGKFDYLTMVGKVGLANIEPDSAYLADNATGPARGAALLFGVPGKGAANVRHMDNLVIALDDTLQVGMQVIEDSLCNWQKSPTEFEAFRG